VGKSQACAVAILIFPKKGDAAGVEAERINRCAEIEIFGGLPLEVAMQFVADGYPPLMVRILL
jgi:hypothetical protein